MKTVKNTTVLLEMLECYRAILGWTKLFLFCIIDNLTHALKVIMIRNLIPENWHLRVPGFQVIRRNFVFAEQRKIWTSVLNLYKAKWYKRKYYCSSIYAVPNLGNSKNVQRLTSLSGFTDGKVEIKSKCKIHYSKSISRAGNGARLWWII